MTRFAPPEPVRRSSSQRFDLSFVFNHYMLATDFANHADYFVRVQPELRYTHWSNETFRSLRSYLRSNRNSLELLLGIYLEQVKRNFY